MRRYSLNGVLFVFLNQSEKLDDVGRWANGHEPDDRYVLWPCGEVWNVRHLKYEAGKYDWAPITDEPFPDESTAWLTAYAHWSERYDKQQSYRTDQLTTGRSNLPWANVFKLQG